MGQVLEGGSVSTGGVGQGIFDVLAGEPIAKGDLVEFGYNGKAYKVDVTDNAAVANINYGTGVGGGQIVPQTYLSTYSTVARYRQAVIQGDDASIFCLHSYQSSSTAGMLLKKYSSKGALLADVQINTTEYMGSYQINRLNNGNLLLTATGTGGVRYAIYSQELVRVKQLTIHSADPSYQELYYKAVPLAEGGFALIYQQAANPLLLRMTTFDDNGNVVLPATTIWTATGTGSAMSVVADRLSDGNIAVALRVSNSGGSIGLFYGVFTPDGIAVKTMTNIDTASGNQVLPELSVMPGYFAIAKGNGTNVVAAVFNNSGVQQGGTFLGSTTLSSDNIKLKLVNDGSANFYLIWHKPSSNYSVLTKIPLSGANFISVDYVSSTANEHNRSFDAFYQDGLILVFFVSTNPFFFVLDTKSMMMLSTSLTQMSSTQAAESIYPRCIPSGDFSFIAMWETTASTATLFYVGKYANTSIIGVAQAAAAADSLVPVASPAGGYAANYIKGTVSKAFDHSAANIIGNKGAIMNYGAVLKGI